MFLPLATRGIDAVGGLVSSLPDAVVVLFALLTTLGGQWFVFVALSVGYWFGGAVAPGVDRRRAAFLLGCALCALALVTTLKFTFRLPRPPGAGTARAVALPGGLAALYEYAASADGFGFPSGHAMAATLVWGGGALALDVGRRRTRVAVGAAVVGLVAVSRVVIGVHYLVDVLAGIAVGAATLALLSRIGAVEKPGRAFSLALLVAVVGSVLEFGPEQFVLLGATLGARVAWGAVGGDLIRLPASRRDGVVLTVVGLPTLGGLFGAIQALEPVAPLAFGASAVVIAGVLTLPLALDVLRERRTGASTG
jgi:membrane-associated phospholipid phosphatase